MKTEHTIGNISGFLIEHEQAIPGSVTPLTEGLVSQAFSFEAETGKYVCRLAENDKGFRADEFAFTHFGDRVPIPAIKNIAQFDPGTFYCVSDHVEGEAVLSLSREEKQALLPELERVLSLVYTTDISQSTGYGQINTETGNAGNTSWKDKLEKIRTYGQSAYEAAGQRLGLDQTLVGELFAQLESNLQFASETRRLLHSDPGFGNFIAKDGKVVALIDWEYMKYGDWLCDFARINFYQSDVATNAQAFAEQYGLETEHLAQRESLYKAATGLWAIYFADTSKNQQAAQWLRDKLESKIS